MSGPVKAGDLAQQASWEAHKRDHPGAEDESDGIDWFEPAGPAPQRKLPPAEMRPPDFLTPMEAMKDIYMRVRHRASPKTQELLEGADLDDLLGLLRRIFEADLDRDARSRLKPEMRMLLRDEDGPLLIGFDDPRLTEPWRLFLDGWEIWVPKDAEDGVELFWEGEAENEDGSVLEISQALSFREGELNLDTKLGDATDGLTFDGEHFYRLETERP